MANNEIGSYIDPHQTAVCPLQKQPKLHGLVKQALYATEQ